MSGRRAGAGEARRQAAALPERGGGTAVPAAGKAKSQVSDPLAGQQERGLHFEGARHHTTQQQAALPFASGGYAHQGLRQAAHLLLRHRGLAGHAGPQQILHLPQGGGRQLRRGAATQGTKPVCRARDPQEVRKGPVQVLPQPEPAESCDHRDHHRSGARQDLPAGRLRGGTQWSLSEIPEQTGENKEILLNDSAKNKSIINIYIK